MAWESRLKHWYSGPRLRFWPSPVYSNWYALEESLMMLLHGLFLIFQIWSIYNICSVRYFVLYYVFFLSYPSTISFTLPVWKITLDNLQIFIILIPLLGSRSVFLVVLFFPLNIPLESQIQDVLICIDKKLRCGMDIRVYLK